MKVCVLQPEYSADYSRLMTTQYQIEEHIVSRKSITPGNDSADEYYLHCDHRQFGASQQVYDRCQMADVIVTVSVADYPKELVVIWLDSDGDKHQVIKRLYQILE